MFGWTLYEFPYLYYCLAIAYTLHWVDIIGFQEQGKGRTPKVLPVGHRLVTFQGD